MWVNNLRRYGAAPYRVAVLHGGPGASGEMAPVARELSTSHGILEPLQTAASLAGQVDELRSVLERFALPPVTLIGFSWGAWLGFIFSARYPLMVKKLILVGSGPFEGRYVEEIQDRRFSRLSRGERDEVKSLNEILDDPMSKDKGMAFDRFGKIFARADAYDPSVGEPEPVDFRVDIHEKVWKEASEWRRVGKLLEAGKDITCPVIAIHGDYDPHPAEGVEKPLRGILRSFRFVLLDRCGHKPWIERYGKDPFYGIIKNELETI